MNIFMSYLRMGTHPSGPARVSDSDELLLDWLSKRSSAVGKVPKHYTGSDLPFMFKVLSVRTALSIQVRIELDMADISNNDIP